MAEEKKTETTTENEEIQKIADKLGDELTFGSSFGRYWFVYVLATFGGAALGALLGWSTSRLLELADWLGISIGAGTGALTGFGTAAGVTRQLDKNTIGAIRSFAVEAEKQMKAQEVKFNNEMTNLRSNLRAEMQKQLEGEIESVREDVDDLGTQIEKTPTAKKPAAKKPAAKKPAAKNTAARKGTKKKAA